MTLDQHCYSFDMKCNLLFSLALVISTHHLIAQPGSIDESFAIAGFYNSQIDSIADEAKSMAFQSDGKIVTAGYFGEPGLSETSEDFYVRRFNADGSRDSSFGDNGIAIIDLAGGTDSAWDVKIQEDGKILVAGFGWQSWERALIMRLNSDGSLDTEFSGDGMAVIEIGGFSDRLWDIEIQDDGKIVGCGTCFVSGSNNDWCALRLHPNGNLDTSFGDGGVLSLDLGAVQISANDLIILEDGRILMAGYTNPSGTYLMQLAMLNSDGSLDETWNDDGLAELSIDFMDDAIQSIAIQDDGKILAGGYSWNGSDYDFALVRFNSDGEPDQSFGEAGFVTTPVGNANEFINSLFIRSDGRIVVGGNGIIDGSWFDFIVAMYNSDGSLEADFGNNGIVTTALSSDEDYIFEIKPDADGNILAVGTTENDSSGEEVYQMAMVKYLGDLSLGIIDEYSGQEVLVYPNPIQSFTRLQFELINEGSYSVELYDLSGRYIEQLSPEMTYLAGRNEINLEIPHAIPSGSYLLRVESESNSINVQVFKQE